MGRTPSIRRAVSPLALTLALPLAGLLMAPVPAAAEGPSPALRGSATFRTYCASCHGKTAHGDGPVAEHLRFAPADLTQIARRNGDKFPAEKVARIIDGRDRLGGHGGTDMPVWGDVFLESREGYDRAKVREKVEELVQYLASLQEPRP